MKKFADFSEEGTQLPGDKVKIDTILNKPIVITGYRISPSKFDKPDYLCIQFEFEGKVYVVFTGSTVLMRQMRKYQNQIPFETTIVQHDKYFTFS